jgi:hypothetical protein
MVMMTARFACICRSVCIDLFMAFPAGLPHLKGFDISRTVSFPRESYIQPT